MVKGADELKGKLGSIDGRGYKAYKGIKGSYISEDLILHIDHVQGDPFAAPSSLRASVGLMDAGFPEHSYHPLSREIALRDLITRRFHGEAAKKSRPDKGSGKSGMITIDRPGQEILERTSVVIEGEMLEARFYAGLPAFGRRIAGFKAMDMFFEELPSIVRGSMFFEAYEEEEVMDHVRTKEDSSYLREKLREMGLVSFIGDGSLLPRRSGIDDRPMERGAVPFRSPESMRVSVDLPNRGEVTGMGVEEGVTLVVGGGYHGKSTVLRAVELGIYDHVPGDGRELVVTDPNAVKIRAEDGRKVTGTDISSFINDLPFGSDTDNFSTENTSGSTSQAANIVEALEVKASLLLIDEDTSATNFMIRDHRMQELVSRENEPITPFIDKVRPLYHEHGVSSIIVVGGSGDYFDVASRVIMMENYLPKDVTVEAKEIAKKFPTKRENEGGSSFGKLDRRVPVRESFDTRKGRRAVSIKTKGLHSILFGRTHIDLTGLEQLMDMSQTRAIADGIRLAKEHMDGKRSLDEVLDIVMELIQENGLDVLSGSPNGSYAMFRKMDIAAGINRMRTLEIS
ncbi:MAG: ABC-ATPase domain-containing protein [Thermoplasmatota archaeon]